MGQRTIAGHVASTFTGQSQYSGVERESHSAPTLSLEMQPFSPNDQRCMALTAPTHYGLGIEDDDPLGRGSRSLPNYPRKHIPPNAR